MIEFYRIDKETNKILGIEKVESEDKLICKEYLYEKVDENKELLFKDTHKNYLYNNGLTEVDKPTEEVTLILLSELNKEYEAKLNNLKAGLTTFEIDTWIKQEAEAKAWIADNTVATPFIDSMLLSRQDHTKESLVNKILEKAKNYTIEVGKLLGEKQAKEKEIILQ